MQTFMPYPNMALSAMVLDPKRLGKQRSEIRLILQHLNPDGMRAKLSPIHRHPATVMWRGYSAALMYYHDLCVREWLRRGYVNNLTFFNPPEESIILPPWIGDERVHASHRGNLLRKDPTWYRAVGFDDLPMEGYFWPVGEDYENPNTVEGESEETRRWIAEAVADAYPPGQDNRFRPPISAGRIRAYMRLREYERSSGLLEDRREETTDGELVPKPRPGPVRDARRRYPNLSKESTG